MTLTLAKLQALKRQAGASAPAGPAPAPAPGAQASMEQIRRLLRVRAPQAAGRVPAQDRELPGTQLAPGLFLRETRLADEPVPAHLDGTFDRRDALPCARLLFFDTETTGLAGGTGTRAFMIGAADWQAGALRVRQLTIASTAAEAAMLEAFRGWLAPDTVLVSYNGKGYDAPLLAARYRLARMTSPLQGLTHIDLLYPTRRRYRGVHENCRLATIEQRVLRIVREDDLPGSEAPAAWLRYLRGGSAQPLRRVLAHNHQDVVTLSRLLRHLSALPQAEAAV
ncbi:MAG TPA: ribonuclease H-like domain-containing protein [Lysobacter sp.]|nr:ribonuclease H-like domain-containing protein [Lysobacter sp.]